MNYILDRPWEISWGVAMKKKRIHTIMKKVKVVVEDTFREGNKVVDFIANYFFFFAGTDRLIYYTF